MGWVADSILNRLPFCQGGGAWGCNFWLACGILMVVRLYQTARPSCVCSSVRRVGDFFCSSRLEIPIRLGEQLEECGLFLFWLVRQCVLETGSGDVRLFGMVCPFPQPSSVGIVLDGQIGAVQLEPEFARGSVWVCAQIVHGYNQRIPFQQFPSHSPYYTTTPCGIILGMNIPVSGIDMQPIIAVRLAGRVYQFAIVDESDSTIWVSVQSILPLPAKTSHLQPLGEITDHPRCVSSPTHTPILCDRSAYTGEPVARIVHHPTRRSIPLYYSWEWLTDLESRAPIIYQHNDRYWLFSDYNPDQVAKYRERGGKWCSRARCWVFRELPPELAAPVP